MTTTPRYAFLDVIRESSNIPGVRRWQILAVEPHAYFIRLLYSGFQEPEYSRWPHAEAEALTVLEWSPGSKPIGVTCPAGHSRVPVGPSCPCATSTA